MKAKKKTKQRADYPCTQCNGNSFIGFSNVSGPNGPTIGKDERLCTACAKKRGFDFNFTLNT